MYNIPKEDQTVQQHKMASLKNNAHKIILLLYYAILEWILIFLLLLNSFLSYLINKFSTFFGLKPPCSMCSTLDKSQNSFQDVVCEEHAKQLSKLSYCPNHEKLAENGVTVCKFSCCDESLKSNFQFPWLLFKSSWDFLDYIEKKGNYAAKCDHNSTFITHASAEKEDNFRGSEEREHFDYIDIETDVVNTFDVFLADKEQEDSLEDEGKQEGSMTIEELKLELKAQQKAMRALYAELEAERNAATISTNQTMAMITKLQEEKAAMQMEGLQYERMMDEQTEYDQEALQLLNDLMITIEKEKQEVEKELEIYREKVSYYEAKLLTMVDDAESLYSDQLTEDYQLNLDTAANELEARESDQEHIEHHSIGMDITV